jgi:hypothetical protein
VIRWNESRCGFIERRVGEIVLLGKSDGGREG